MTSLPKYACAMALLGSLGCTGPEGPAGPAGPEGPKGEPGAGVTPGVVSLQPTRALIGRRASIQIGAVGASFDKDRTRLDPGDPNIKVERLSVLSPTLLQADLSIGPADPAQPDTYARLGEHDFTLTTTLPDRSETLRLKGVPIEAPLRAVPVDAALKPASPLRQGGVARFLLQSQDPATPLDYSFALKILDERIAVTSIQVSRDRALVSATLDVDAPPSAALFLRPPGASETQTFVLPAGVAGQSLTIEPRKPVELQPGKEQTDKLLDGNDNKLYKLPAAAGEQIVRLSVNRGVSTSGVPTLAVLPESGKWRERVPTLVVSGALPGQIRNLFLAPAGKPVHVLAYDAQGSQPMEYTLSAAALDLFQPMDPAPSVDPAMPNQQIDPQKGANYFKQLALPPSPDRHYFEVTPTQAGRLALISGLNPSQRNGMMIEILSGSCTGTLINRIYPSSNYTTLALLDAEASKTFCVAVSRYSNGGGVGYSLAMVPVQ